MRLPGHLICRGNLTIINKKGHLQMQVTLSLCYKKDTRSKRASMRKKQRQCTANNFIIKVYRISARIARDWHGVSTDIDKFCFD